MRSEVETRGRTREGGGRKGVRNLQKSREHKAEKVYPGEDWHAGGAHQMGRPRGKEDTARQTSFPSPLRELEAGPVRPGHHDHHHLDHCQRARAWTMVPLVNLSSSDNRIGKGASGWSLGIRGETMLSRNIRSTLAAAAFFLLQAPCLIDSFCPQAQPGLCPSDASMRQSMCRRAGILAEISTARSLSILKNRGNGWNVRLATQGGEGGEEEADRGGEEGMVDVVEARDGGDAQGQEAVKAVSGVYAQSHKVMARTDVCLGLFSASPHPIPCSSQFRRKGVISMFAAVIQATMKFFVWMAYSLFLSKFSLLRRVRPLPSCPSSHASPSKSLSPAPCIHRRSLSSAHRRWCGD